MADDSAAAGTRRRKKADDPPVEEPAGNGKPTLELRDRIVEFRRVPADELLDNERNWRTHPYAQSRALDELLEHVGIAGALTAYHSERNGGALTLIDGHERRTRDADWPVLILDVTDEEADLLLLTLDPLAALAGTDADALSALLDIASTGTPALEDLMRMLGTQASEAQLDNATGGGEDIRRVEDTAGPPEMELQAFEHYDYVVVLFRSSLDWMQAKERLGLKKEAFTLRDGETRRIGRGRVVEGSKLLGMLK